MWWIPGTHLFNRCLAASSGPVWIAAPVSLGLPEHAHWHLNHGHDLPRGSDARSAEVKCGGRCIDRNTASSSKTPGARRVSWTRGGDTGIAVYSDGAEPTATGAESKTVKMDGRGRLRYGVRSVRGSLYWRSRRRTGVTTSDAWAHLCRRERPNRPRSSIFGPYWYPRPTAHAYPGLNGQRLNPIFFIRVVCARIIFNQLSIHKYYLYSILYFF
jgi:hypothetical protein